MFHCLLHFYCVDVRSPRENLGKITISNYLTLKFLPNSQVFVSHASTDQMDFPFNDNEEFQCQTYIIGFHTYIFLKVFQIDLIISDFKVYLVEHYDRQMANMSLVRCRLTESTVLQDHITMSGGPDQQYILVIVIFNYLTCL